MDRTQDLWGCRMVSSTGMLAVDPLDLVDSVLGHCYIPQAVLGEEGRDWGKLLQGARLAMPASCLLRRERWSLAPSMPYP